MAKKKEMKQIFENLELESSEANPNLNDRPQDQAQPSEIPVGDEDKIAERLMSTEEPAEQSSVDEPQETEKGVVPNTGDAFPEQPKPESEEDNPDDLLDVRRRTRSGRSLGARSVRVAPGHGREPRAGRAR